MRSQGYMLHDSVTDLCDQPDRETKLPNLHSTENPELDTMSGATPNPFDEFKTQLEALLAGINNKIDKVGQRLVVVEEQQKQQQANTDFMKMFLQSGFKEVMTAELNKKLEEHQGPSGGDKIKVAAPEVYDGKAEKLDAFLR